MPGPDPVLSDRHELVATLEDHRWVLAHAAKALGVSRQTLYASLERLRIPRKPMDEEYVREHNRHAASAPRPSRRSAA